MGPEGRTESENGNSKVRTDIWKVRAENDEDATLLQTLGEAMEEVATSGRPKAKVNMQSPTGVRSGHRAAKANMQSPTGVRRSSRRFDVMLPCREDEVEESTAKAARTAASDEVLAAEAAPTAAEVMMATFGPTPDQLRAEAAEADRLANENGDPAKSMAVKKMLHRRWSAFLTEHGDEYGYDEAAG
jgi:hypothetical protein